MYILYKGINSSTFGVDVIAGNEGFGVTPSYRVNLQTNESNDGDVNYTTYNSSGRMLANSREIQCDIIIRRKIINNRSGSVFEPISEWFSRISKVVQWLKSDDYQPLIIESVPTMEWQAIGIVDSGDIQKFTDGAIIHVVFKCKPFTRLHKERGILLGSSISTDYALSVEGILPYERTVRGSLTDTVNYRGTAVSKPRIKIGSNGRYAELTGSYVSVAINNNSITIDTKGYRLFYLEIDTANYTVYLNDTIINEDVHISGALPYLDGIKENIIRVSGFNGKLYLDYDEYFDFTYL